MLRVQAEPPPLARQHLHSDSQSNQCQRLVHPHLAKPASGPLLSNFAMFASTPNASSTSLVLFELALHGLELRNSRRYPKSHKIYRNYCSSIYQTTIQKICIYSVDVRVQTVLARTKGWLTLFENQPNPKIVNIHVCCQHANIELKNKRKTVEIHGSAILI